MPCRIPSPPPRPPFISATAGRASSSTSPRTRRPRSSTGAPTSASSARRPCRRWSSPRSRSASRGIDQTPRLAIVPTAAAGWPGAPGSWRARRRGAGNGLLPGIRRSDRRRRDAASRRRAALPAPSRGAAGGRRGSVHAAAHAGQRRRRRPRRAGAAADLPGAVGGDRDPRHDRASSARALGAASRLHLRHAPARESSGATGCGRHAAPGRRTPGFGFESGLVHGIHVGWSGDQRVFAERLPLGEALLAGGELLAWGEIVVAPGAEVSSPIVYGSWGEGLDQLASRFHATWRARPQHPRRPRPITLNTWEAVYFDHRLPKLLELADVAAEIGVERYVLDDGWFRHRRDDTAGLGDWFVDEGVWPDGLSPLADHVIDRGMEFGLWFEPEMVNPDSDVARAHPEWILRGRDELPPSARQQQVLNLARPDAYAYLLERMTAVLRANPIAYVKWDHNRDLVDAATGPAEARPCTPTRSPCTASSTSSRPRFPGLEIESCASGGARVDLGILDRTDRIWTSDCLDPVERLETQRHTALVVPPEMMGMHLTTPHVHSTGAPCRSRSAAPWPCSGHFRHRMGSHGPLRRRPGARGRVGGARPSGAAARGDRAPGERRHDRPRARRPRRGVSRARPRLLHDREPRRSSPPRGPRAPARARPRPPYRVRLVTRVGSCRSRRSLRCPGPTTTPCSPGGSWPSRACGRPSRTPSRRWSSSSPRDRVAIVMAAAQAEIANSPPTPTA